MKKTILSIGLALIALSGASQTMLQGYQVHVSTNGWLNIPTTKSNLNTVIVYLDSQMLAYTNGLVQLSNSVAMTVSNLNLAVSNQIAQIPSIGYGAFSNSMTANFTATNNILYGVNTAGGAITATMPASSVIGNTVGFLDVQGNLATYPLIVNGGMHTIMGLSELITNAMPNSTLRFIWNGSTWRILQ